MCLGIPGKIIEIYEKAGSKMAKVEFAGIKREVCIDLTPEAEIGDYVIVHVGFSISVIDEKEAMETLNTFEEYKKVQEKEL
jgi:hydrogenase expression/formation protein HypC